MAKIWVELDRDNVRAILKGDGVTDLLKEIGSKVSRKAGADYQVQVGSRKNRAVINVVDPRRGALSREAKTGNLARALGSVR
jgi:hypothetical protein